MTLDFWLGVVVGVACTSLFFVGLIFLIASAQDQGRSAGGYTGGAGPPLGPDSVPKSGTAVRQPPASSYEAYLARAAAARAHNQALREAGDNDPRKYEPVGIWKY